MEYQLRMEAGQDILQKTGFPPLHLQIEGKECFKVES